MWMIVVRERGNHNWKIAGVIELPEAALVVVAALRQAFPRLEWESAAGVQELPE
jgi:hypothetical protein